jgi:protein-S-isoprenylcysteine O-methyltransferase Ste14
MNKSSLTKAELMKLVVSRFIPIMLILVIILVVPAGTFAFWQAWVYLAIILIPMTFVLNYLVKHDPALLERRMRMREKQEDQKLIVKLGYIPFLLGFILPGLDMRFGWSHVPLWVIILCDALVFLGYMIIFLVFRENSYTSRIVEVEQEQTVIQTGPYAIVRHPMYVGVTLMYVFAPLALGSWWAVIPGSVIIPVLVARIISEEKLLVKDLKGYKEYMQKVRYRLIPGIW